MPIDKNMLRSGLIALTLCSCASAPKPATMDEVRQVRKYAEVVVAGALKAATVAQDLGYLDSDAGLVIEQVKVAAPLAFATADAIIEGTAQGTPESALAALQQVIENAMVAYMKLGR